MTKVNQNEKEQLPGRIIKTGPSLTDSSAIRTTASHVMAISALMVLLLPVYWLVATSFKPLEDLFVSPPQFIPENFTVKNYVAQFNPFLIQLFINSFVVGIATAFLSTFAGSLCGYAISRFSFKQKRIVLLFFLAAMAFPTPLLMMSMYSMFLKMSILDTYFSLILGHTATTMPLTVWLMTNFIDQVPIDMEESALVDGVSPFKILVHIVLPMVRPGLAASAIFVFVASWNELIMGLIFVSSPEVRTLPAGITNSFLGEFEGDWSEMMALAVMVTLPIFLIFMVTQKSILKGMTAGAIK